MLTKIENPEEYEVCKFDTVTGTTVYSGLLGELKKEELLWRVDQELTEAFGFPAEVLTLKEIYDQMSKKDCDVVTVVINGPFSGTILQTGNYERGDWYEIGSLNGYA